jgi:glycine cleavage system transcriptional repressor
MSDDRRYMVLTAVGPDQPGLVQRVSELISEAGANLEDSRMAILGGEFALILLFSGNAEAIARVDQRAVALSNQGLLTVALKPTARSRTLKNYLPYRLRVSGEDRVGIVSKLSKLLAGRGINVASLDSRVSYAPLSGTPMFQLQAELQIPGELALAELRRDLANACEEENLDFTFEVGEKLQF